MPAESRHNTFANSPIDQNRWLLCIPHGGLNDTFSQIELCWQYAARYNRILVLDTTQSGIFRPFSDYFTIKSPPIRIAEYSTEIESKLNVLNCRPLSLTGKIGTYKSAYSSSIRNFVDKTSDAILSFDFSFDHPEQLLVHEQCGSYVATQAILDHIVIAPQTLPRVLDGLARLPSNYLGIHIRNTDYQTDYKKFFKTIYPDMIGNPLLICSDDGAVIQFAKMYFEESSVLTTSDQLNFASGPLHKFDTHQNDMQRHKAVLLAITDLLALAGATKLYTTKNNKGFFSGFSRLAEYINKNRSIAMALLNDKSIGSHAVQ